MSTFTEILSAAVNNSPRQSRAKQMQLEASLKSAVFRYREKRYERLTAAEKESALATWYEKNTGEALDLEHPKNLGQVIQWLKLYDNIPAKTKLSDKYLVREWIGQQLGESFLIPVYGAWDAVHDIPFHELPAKVVLKANHGSGMNYVVRNMGDEDLRALKRLLGTWLKTPYNLTGMEQQYHAISRKIIAEQYIEQADGNLLDYKIHCFNGNPRIIEVIGDRDFSSHAASVAFLDTDWQRMALTTQYTQYDRLPDRPACLQDLLAAAEKLSRDFAYVRVDMYIIENQIKFGEMTFTPSAGIGEWSRQVPADWVHI